MLSLEYYKLSVQVLSFPCDSILPPPSHTHTYTHTHTTCIYSHSHMHIPPQAYCAEMVCYDYHKIIKSGGSNIETTLSQSLLPLTDTFLSSHGIYHCDNGQPMRLQTGTIRTNCLDCLDRTNSVQNFLSQHVSVVCVRDISCECCVCEGYHM